MPTSPATRERKAPTRSSSARSSSAKSSSAIPAFLPAPRRRGLLTAAIRPRWPESRPQSGHLRQMATTHPRPRLLRTRSTPPPHPACSVDNLRAPLGAAQNARMRQPSELPPHLRNRPFTVAEARTAGLGRRRTRALDLVSPCYGVRAAAATPDSLLERVHALTAVTGAVVSHLSAAVLWGFPLPQALENLSVVHLTSRPGQRAVRHKNVVGHQQSLEPEEIVPGVRVSCTSPLRTWFDLAGILSLDELVIAGDFLLRRRNPLTTIDELDAFLAGKQGRAGYRRAMRARSLMRAGHGLPQRDRTPAASDSTWPARTRNQRPHVRRDRRLDPGPGPLLRAGKDRDSVRRRASCQSGPASQRHLPG